MNEAVRRRIRRTNESSIKIQSESCTLAVVNFFHKLLGKLVLVVMSISFMSWRVIGVEKLAPSTKLRPHTHQRKFNRCFRVAAKLARLMILTRAGAKKISAFREIRRKAITRGDLPGVRGSTRSKTSWTGR